MPGQKEIRLEESWKKRLAPEFEQDYMKQLKQFLLERKRAGAHIYPPGDKIFNALDSTPFRQVRVVILGQDPYHGPMQAHGLCFSVNPGVPLPPSLVNIFKELEADLGIPPGRSGDLRPWARQGVLLLNTTLTVRAHEAGSHQGRGWERFSDQVIRAVGAKQERVVFMLWGAHARKKAALVDRTLDQPGGRPSRGSRRAARVDAGR